uniref:Uncharacterized protein n=1 Tax=Anguilla anguilla TaxID=7936 RepID=A0A0E9UAL1_ANGAN
MPVECASMFSNMGSIRVLCNAGDLWSGAR